MNGVIHASSSSMEPSNNNEIEAEFSPLECHGTNTNDIYESGAGYSNSNITPQSQEYENNEASTSDTMPTPIDLSTSGLKRCKRMA